MTHADFEHSPVRDEARCGFLPMLAVMLGFGIPALNGMAVAALAYFLLKNLKFPFRWNSN